MIVIDFNSLVFSESKQLTGIIYLQNNDIVFPDKYWNDFVVIVSSWWLEGFMKLVESPLVTRMEFLFMDGPFLFIIEKNYDSWVIHLKKREACMMILIVDNPEKLLKKFLKEINHLIRVCNENDWSNSDILTLEKQYESLKKVLKNDAYYFNLGNSTSDLS